MRRGAASHPRAGASRRQLPIRYRESYRAALHGTARLSQQWAGQRESGGRDGVSFAPIVHGPPWDTTRTGVKAPLLPSFCRPHSPEIFRRVCPMALRAVRAYVALISKAKTKVDSFIWNWGCSEWRWQLGLSESNGRPGTRSSSAGVGGTAIGSDALSRFPLLLSAGRAAAGHCLFQLTLGFAFSSCQPAGLSLLLP